MPTQAPTGFDIGIGGSYCNFCPNSRLPCSSLDLNDPFRYFRYFSPEQIDKELRMGPGQNNLWAPGILADIP